MMQRIWQAALPVLLMSGFLFIPTLNAKDQGANVTIEKKSDNPVIDIPVGGVKFLYGGFQGFGQMFDEFITGYKAPKKFGEPGPVTQFEDRYSQLNQMDYGMPPMNDFAETASEVHERGEGYYPEED